VRKRKASARERQTVRARPHDFVKAWQESSSVAEVAAKVRSNKNACRTRAFRYREMGVPLKLFPPVMIEPPDWNELAEYAASLLPVKKSEAGDARPAEPLV
jgi:hypothetical protein